MHCNVFATNWNTHKTRRWTNVKPTLIQRLVSAGQRDAAVGQKFLDLVTSQQSTTQQPRAAGTMLLKY